MKEDYLEQIKPKTDAIRSQKDELEKELRGIKEDKAMRLSVRVQKWFDDYDRGVNFEARKLRIIYIDEDEKYVIISMSGGSCWAGVGMHGYASAEHWIARVDGGRYMQNKIMEIEGRLSKEKKVEMITHIEKLKRGKLKL